MPRTRLQNSHEQKTKTVSWKGSRRRLLQQLLEDGVAEQSFCASQQASSSLFLSFCLLIWLFVHGSFYRRMK